MVNPTQRRKSKSGKARKVKSGSKGQVKRAERIKKEKVRK